MGAWMLERVDSAQTLLGCKEMERVQGRRCSVHLLVGVKAKVRGREGPWCAVHRKPVSFRRSPVLVAGGDPDAGARHQWVLQM